MVILDSLDNVEENDKQFFEETEDKKFKLNRAKLEDAAKAGLVKKNKELLGKVKDAEKFAKFKDVNDDEWSAYQEWKEAQGDDDGEEDTKKDGKKPDLDLKKALKEQQKKLAADAAVALAEKDKAIEAERSKFDSYKFEQELTDEALEAGVISARLKKFRIAAISEGVFAYREGKLVVLDEDGEPTSETPADKLNKMANAEDWKFFFGAKEAGGGSGKLKGGPTAGGKDLKRSKMSDKEKSDYISQNGNAAFLRLPL